MVGQRFAHHISQLLQVTSKKGLRIHGGINYTSQQLQVTNQHASTCQLVCL